MMSPPRTGLKPPMHTLSLASGTSDFFHKMLMINKFREKKNVGAASAPRRWAEENELGRLVYIDAASRRVAACTAKNITCPAACGLLFKCEYDTLFMFGKYRAPYRS